MIKIIRGAYGLKKGNTIVPKTVKDEPFSCDKAEEKRLVALGVAQYVTKAEAEAEEADEETKTETEEKAEVEAEEEKALYTDETGLVELKEIAKAQGATDEDLKPLRSKAQVRELIDKLVAEKSEDGEGETEEAPELNTDDGVVE